jgi:outer membrane protein OmpA-like peptidoglycan-associated protein
MVVSETGAQASCAKKPRQARVCGAAMLAAASWLLAGCSTFPSMNPINWWHRSEGGKIAEQRPAPPGADQPYPNISSVPSKPEAADAEALKRLTASLVADRTNAQHAAQAAPLADPSSPTASPDLFGVGSTPPPSAAAAPAASASMPAVTAPPPAASAPTPAPRKPVQSTPLEAPAATFPAATSGSAAVTPQAKTEPAAPQPALPAGPPPRPGAAGPPPTPAVVAEPAPVPSGGVTATIVFLEGTSNLSQPAADEVKSFAAKRGKATIGVTGYGDAASSDPAAQSVALNLGLSRAQSIVESLKAAGVPGDAIRISAEASGRGALLHLLQ